MQSFTAHTLVPVADETICIGVTRTNTVLQSVFGSPLEIVGGHAEGAAVMDRKPENSPVSIRKTIVQRFKV